MTIYDYFENSNSNKETLCVTPLSTYTLKKDFGRIGLHISIAPNDRRIIFDKETICQEIDKLISQKCAETIALIMDIKINQILN